jgi:hypothetical protein
MRAFKVRVAAVVTSENNATKQTLSNTPSVGDAISISDAVVTSVPLAA